MITADADNQFPMFLTQILFSFNVIILPKSTSQATRLKLNYCAAKNHGSMVQAYLWRMHLYCIDNRISDILGMT
jgi:hypothetical protein